MIDIRCEKCNKKLAEGEYRYLEIKCPRCKTLNKMSATSTGIESNYDKSNNSVARR